MASLRSRIEALEARTKGRSKADDVQRQAINRIWDLLEQSLPGGDMLTKVDMGTFTQLVPTDGKSHNHKKSALAARIKAQATTSDDEAVLSAINADAAVFGMTGAEFVVWDVQLLDSF